jgi:hypothetical protein
MKKMNDFIPNRQQPCTNKNKCERNEGKLPDT